MLLEACTQSYKMWAVLSVTVLLIYDFKQITFKSEPL